MAGVAPPAAGLTPILIIKRTAERDMRQLPPSVFWRVNQHIISLRFELRPPGVRKLQGAETGWRLRVGDYRIIYQIDDSARSITIVRIRHRRDVYRP
ncbi:MAG: type II toxin-antitoxin system RelE/ParE family toxin [Candidatus Promineifilaceae bacterium]